MRGHKKKHSRLEIWRLSQLHIRRNGVCQCSEAALPRHDRRRHSQKKPRILRGFKFTLVVFCLAVKPWHDDGSCPARQGPGPTKPGLPAQAQWSHRYRLMTRY